jgi:Cytochrome b5-like Heme/Steroid binding domain
MINHKILLGGVFAIIVVVSGAYVLLNGGNTSTESEYAADTTSGSVTAGEPLGEAPVGTPDGGDSIAVPTEEVVVETEPEKTVPPTPAPTPTPTPAPTPAPAPTPTPAPTGYTLSDVSAHSDISSCWTIINGSVYDVTAYITRHPGGQRNILKICGKDGTSLFESQHGGESRPESTLAQYRIGAYRE